MFRHALWLIPLTLFGCHGAVSDEPHDASASDTSADSQADVRPDVGVCRWNYMGTEHTCPADGKTVCSHGDCNTCTCQPDLGLACSTLSCL